MKYKSSQTFIEKNRAELNPARLVLYLFLASENEFLGEVVIIRS
jgi:hypothetical protein